MGEVVPRHDGGVHYSNAMTTLLRIPGIRGLWDTCSFDTASLLHDQTPYGNDLTAVATPLYTRDDFRSYATLDGLNDAWGVASSAQYDILGTETYIESASRGLSLGCWIYLDTLGLGDRYIISKWNPGVSQSWRLYQNAGTVTFEIEDSGGTNDSQASSTALVTGQWYWVSASFTPSGELSIVVDEQDDSKTTALANLRNSTSGFAIGASGATTLFMGGRFSVGFLSAMNMSIPMQKALYYKTRAHYFH
jgi:hypothetical protein